MENCKGKKSSGMTKKIQKTEAEWRARLTQEQYEVTRKHATERAFSGKYWDNHDDGIYFCICCGASLFHSDTKFESGSGWPSFTTPINEEHVETQEDRSLFMTRTEVHCSFCEAHLGHVFPDGPPVSGGLRYCINSASLFFEPED